MVHLAISRLPEGSMRYHGQVYHKRHHGKQAEEKQKNALEEKIMKEKLPRPLESRNRHGIVYEK
jgi:hypothetical protein